MSDVGAPAGAAIAGFWRRLAAAFFDAVILGVPAYVVGYQFFDQLAALGQNGRFIGATISLAYFGILNSSLGNGQTLGKRLLGVRVVGASGSTIGLPRALARAFVLIMPYYLNGFDLTPFAGSDDVQTVTALGVVASFVVFGLGGAMAYLYIFNRKTRQSLHDLLLETYVVRAQPQGAVVPRVWPVHVAIALTLIAGSLVLPASLQSLVGTLVSDETYAAFRGMEHELAALPDVQRVSVATETIASWSSQNESTTTTILNVTVYLRKRVDDAAPLIKDVARAVLKREPTLLGNQQLKVTVTTGFDIGIVQATNSQWQSGTAAEWRKELDGPDAGKMLEVKAEAADTVSQLVQRTWQLLREVQGK